MSENLTARLAAFADGQLTEEDLEALEREMDARPSLQAAFARALAAGEQEMSSEPSSSLTVGDVIGKGGMAVVHAGVQRSLDRPVAVKLLRRPASQQATDLLVQEAQLTSRLEHPNIVPVHDIVLNDQGEPQVVLKHITGSVWSVLLREPEEVRARFATDDPLEWHLEVLVSVCRALDYAHAQGVVHRDVKPSNVMVGEFGEVYLLDWGLAVEIGDEPGGLLCSETAIGGTPGYLAPEQLQRDGRIGVWTDVHAIGATLLQVLTGQPPTVREPRSTHPETPTSLAERRAGIPDLRSLAESCLLLDHTARPKRVAIVRARIEESLRHRGSNRLLAEADTRAQAARVARDEGNAAVAVRASAESAFGYRAALEIWPENEAARERALALTEARIDAARHRAG